MTFLDITPEQTSKLLVFAENLARRAGDMILTAFNTPPKDYDRKSATDPVTETDRAVEAMIFDEIRKHYPDHALIGEESASDAKWTDLPTWIVDPIDGTANFVHRIPMCAVSIALTVRRKVKVGVIYNPILDELYSATDSSQSTLNGIPIQVSSVTSLSSACVVTECGSNREESKTEETLRELGRVLREQTMCVRMLGSCALNLAAVACGKCDIVYEKGPYAWDLAAGVLLVERAGGIVRGGGLSGVDKELDLMGRSILAFAPGLESVLREKFASRTKTVRDN